jgi:hypothetical protein
MQRLSNRKLRLGITLKMFKDGKLVSSTSRRVKSRIFEAITHASFPKGTTGHIRVSYYPGVYNDGHYDNKKDLKEALTMFTEKRLLDYIESQEWPTAGRGN